MFGFLTKILFFRFQVGKAGLYRVRHYRMITYPQELPPFYLAHQDFSGPGLYWLVVLLCLGTCMPHHAAARSYGYMQETLIDRVQLEGLLAWPLWILSSATIIR